MSNASSYELRYDRAQGPIRISTKGSLLMVSVDGTTVLTLDRVYGRIRIVDDDKVHTLSKKNCVNRFFDLLGINRYELRTERSGLKLFDSKTCNVIAFTNGKMDFSIPTKATLKAIMNVDRYHYASVCEWIDEADRKEKELLEKKVVIQAVQQAQTPAF